ncbi:helix-turn-helix domain-containing protein [Xenophilus azovorans]|uniref:helix-turn-helix domain-containing protein n=1 Tax=Xenophilus azovorans TaxID=151755 RepID=UPI00056DD307|nr:helix-turn-helix transcriptional regulator [Xenophilus azovorans]
MPSPSPRHAHDPALLALGMAIRTLRMEQGVSQEELAYRSTIERSYMSSIERGAQNPGVMALLRIAQGLGVSLERLMGRAGL